MIGNTTITSGVLEDALDTMARLYERTGAGALIFARLEDELEVIYKKEGVQRRIQARAKGNAIRSKTASLDERSRP